MLGFLIDIIFDTFGGHVFQQIVGTSMGKKSALLLADLFLYLYESDFLQGLLSENDESYADPLISCSAI